MPLARTLILCCALALTLASIPMPSNAADLTTPSGLRIIDTQPGTGPEPQAGQTVSVNYTGWLYVDGKKGRKFDSSYDRGTPITFPLGDEGLSTMHVGGKRTLIIPPDLAYGDRGAGGVIPPGATLIFDVELVKAQ